MAFTPNLGPGTRVGYALFGLGLIALGGYVLEVRPLFDRWAAFVAIAAGVVVAVEGAVGF